MKHATSGLFLAVSAAATGACAAQNQAQWEDVLDVRIADDWRGDNDRAFDFWIGEWDANWRPPSEETFEHAAEGSWSHQRVFPILGGKAIVELAWARDNPAEPSQRGFSIRYFDPARERWVMAQNWPNQRTTGSAFTDQLIGAEHFGRRTMYSHTARPLPDGGFSQEHRRYNFTDVRETSFRWDGSNTSDNGQSWTTWYVVDFNRLGEFEAIGAAGSDFPGVFDKALCTEEPHGAFDAVAGSWQGVATDAGGGEVPAAMHMGVVLDGCGVIGVVQAGDEKSFRAIGYHERFERWVSYELSAAHGEPHHYRVAEAAGEGAAFEAASALAIKDEKTPYLSPQAFDTAGALARTVWEKISEDEIVLREETRNAAAGDWRLERRIVLTPLR